MTASEQNKSNHLGIPDPSPNVREMISEAVNRVDDLHAAEIRRVNDRFTDRKDYFDLRITDTVAAANQRFDAQQLALKDALIAQEKSTANALEGTKEAINKADINTDKRFQLLSEKIDGITDTMNKNTGERGVYVTHSDLTSEMEKLRVSFSAMLQPVVNFMNSQTGQSKGQDKIWAYVIAAAGILIAIVTYISTHPVPVVTEIIK